MTPKRAATIGAGLYVGVFIAAMGFMWFVDDSFGPIWPAIVAYPFSHLTWGLRSSIGTDATLVISGAISTGCWYSLIFVAGKFLDSQRDPPAP